MDLSTFTEMQMSMIITMISIFGLVFGCKLQTDNNENRFSVAKLPFHWAPR